MVVIILDSDVHGAPSGVVVLQKLTQSGIRNDLIINESLMSSSRLGLTEGLTCR